MMILGWTEKPPSCSDVPRWLQVLVVQILWVSRAGEEVEGGRWACGLSHQHVAGPIAGISGESCPPVLAGSGAEVVAAEN